MTQPNPTSEDNSKAEERRNPNLSRWFWGTIVLLLVITVSLELLAAWQASRQGENNGSGGGSTVGQTGANATQVEQLFNKAGAKAEKVREQIRGRLDEVYAPVYEGIPRYMDFHYSLTGEWLELGAVAMGNLGSGLEEHLFDGFDTRLNTASEQLALEFEEVFQKALHEAISAEPGGAEALGPVATKALQDAQDRMKTTAGTFGAVLVGGATLKVFTTAFAKKLAIKLAARVGTKTGMKWAGAATGAGVGAAACSWTGPGAAACAVIGGAITWVATDVALIKLDEYVTRDDFERDLRDLIDDHKNETQRAFEEMLADKLLAVDTQRKVAVREISLSELKDADRLMTCEAAASILDRYNAIRRNLQARSSANIESFQADLRTQETSHLLALWIDSMKAAIAHQDLRPWVFGPVILSVDFPEELQDGRKAWAELRVAGTDIDFAKTEGDVTGKYSLNADVGEKIFLRGRQRFELELIQDRGWTSWNRDFHGGAWFDVSESLSEGSGITPKAVTSITMVTENKQEPVPRVEVEVSLGGVMLPVREMPDFCTQ